ncbi:MAG: carbohydrate kinase [Bacteroidota bacterium]|nr:carbohydrate kinase [Bacteroidota bacterium]
MSKIYAVGETVLDIIFKGTEPQTAKPGGSSFNASITLGRLGAPITFISEVGKDRVGDLIQNFMEKNGVNANSLARFDNGKSALALAFLNELGDAEYQFYKDYPHQRLVVDFPEFRANDLLIFGSFYALNPGIRPRVKVLLDKAAAAGSTIIYDPNFRSSHLAERDELVPVIKENMGYASLLRASNEDLINIFNVDNADDAWDQVRPYCDALVYTANAGGVFLRTTELSFHMEVEPIEPLSTIGAGDTFNAGLLYGIWKEGYQRGKIKSLDQEQWEGLISTAIRFAGEVCLSYDNYLPLEYANKFKKSI